MSGLRSQASCEFEEAVRNLTEKTYSAYHSMKNPGICRVSVRTAPFDMEHYLWTQEFENKLFWSDRDSAFEIFGLGIADQIRADERSTPSDLLQSRFSLPMTGSDKSAIRYFGGFAFPTAQKFSPDNGDSEWAAFGSFLLSLPRFELINSEEGSYLVCNLVKLSTSNVSLEELRKQFAALAVSRSENKFTCALPNVTSRQEMPDMGRWNQSVSKALSDFKNSDLRKLVLARRTSLELRESFDGMSLFQRLRDTTPGCYHFYFDFGLKNVFLGAPPERLFRREGTQLWTEAVAGTRPRGNSKNEDEKLATELQNSAKEKTEHQWVKDWISRQLEPFCKEVKMGSENSLLKLSRVQHLRTVFNAILRDGVSEIQILSALYPTPAVGGYPRETALSKISYLEPFERGWYTGCVGWIGENSSEFAVAIRSALVEDNRVHVFSGAGIVEGSEPQKEWQEINYKISDYLSVLNVSQANHSTV